MISIIIPTLNEEKFLPNLLQSLAGQTKKNFEVVVVDGSSQDKTVEVARSFVQKLTKLHIVLSTKANLPLQRNLGANATHGEWLVFIDADSVVALNFIERIESYIVQEHPSLFTTWFRPDTELPADAMIALLGNMTLEASVMLHRQFAPGPLTAVTRDVFNAVGGYNEAQAFHEDMDFSMRVFKHNISLHILPETLYSWSLRRMRQQGTLRVVQQYLLSSLPVLLFKRPMKYMPGYMMGGQLYDKKKRIKQSVLKRYETKLKNLMKEFF